MTKASLILTDDLIEAAQKVGGLPPQPGDPDFDGFESEDDETDPFNPNPESGA
jgi:ribosome maturation factor RimP